MRDLIWKSMYVHMYQSSSGMSIKIGTSQYEYLMRLLNRHPQQPTSHCIMDDSENLDQFSTDFNSLEASKHLTFHYSIQ